MAGTATVSAVQREHATTDEIHSVPPGLYDLHRQEVIPDPWPFYKRLRGDSPRWDPHARVWLVARHVDVSTVLRDGRFSVVMDHGRSRQLAPPTMGPLFDLLDVHLSLVDPPQHTQLRQVLAERFKPGHVRALDGFLATAVATVVDRCAGEGGMDVVAELADTIPLTVLQTVLGLDGVDIATVSRWAGSWAYIFSAPGHVPTERVDEVLADVDDLIRYLRTVVAAHRGRPRDTVTGLLVAAADDGRIGEAELLGNLMLLLAAGHATSAGLISSAAATVADDPELAERLRNDLRLLPAAVEEFARLEPAVQYTTRTARCDVEIAGRCIRRGHTVVLMLAAANRDPDVFTDPDRVWLDRPASARPVTFGRGPHYCFGAELARLETRHVLRGLVTLADLRVAGERRWHTHGNLRRLADLQLTFRARSATTDLLTQGSTA